MRIKSVFWISIHFFAYSDICGAVQERTYSPDPLPNLSVRHTQSEDRGYPSRGHSLPCTRHVLVADNNILQCLIQGMSDMDLAVRIRRSVMEHEAGAPSFFLFSILLLYKSLSCQSSTNCGSFCGRFPRMEFCLRQAQRLAVIHSISSCMV